MTAPKNPPAFPQSYQVKDGYGEYTQHDHGMTLRDWFAGQAIVSLNISTLECWSVQDIAIHVYEVADAMLAAREAKP